MNSVAMKNPKIFPSYEHVDHIPIAKPSLFGEKYLIIRVATVDQDVDWKNPNIPNVINSTICEFIPINV